MRVFVLCTGRCGSLTFKKACSHISNYTSLHESKAKEVSLLRATYPDNHIEIDNRLNFFFGLIDEKYKDDVFFVHLKRNEKDVVKSFMKRFTKVGIMSGFYHSVFMLSKKEWFKKCRTAIMYVKTTNKNIELFLKDRPSICIDIYDPKENFVLFWNAIGAEGDLNKALTEFDVKYNQ